MLTVWLTKLEEKLDLETNGWRRAGLLLLIQLAHLSFGYAIGLAAGDASNVGLDASRKALPIRASREVACSP